MASTQKVLNYTGYYLRGSCSLVLMNTCSGARPYDSLFAKFYNLIHFHSQGPFFSSIQSYRKNKAKIPNMYRNILVCTVFWVNWELGDKSATISELWQFLPYQKNNNNCLKNTWKNLRFESVRLFEVKITLGWSAAC